MWFYIIVPNELREVMGEKSSYGNQTDFFFLDQNVRMFAYFCRKVEHFN